MKNKLKGMKNFKSKLIGLSLVGVLFAACNSEFDRVVPESPNLGGIEYKTPKILYIITDGARGESVRDAQIPNMNALLPNAIYSWNSLGDENGLNATNWADMITGVQKDKHAVVSENFAGNKLADYPAIFSRIKSVNSKIRIALFASTTSFKDKLAAGADVAESLGSDVAVKDKLVDFIKTDTASMIVGQFNNVDVAGNGTEYDIKFPAYKAAIAAFDTQVGEIIAAVKSRPSYAKENWLIIISSNKGGEYPLPVGQDDKTVFSNTKMNTFNIIYNANFNKTFVAKPNVGSFWSGNSPRFLGEPEKTVAITDVKTSPSFNFGRDSSFTISIKVKKRKNPNNTSRGDYYYQWPSFMGKRDRAGWGGGNAPGNPGWDLCLFQNGWRFFAAGGTDFINGIEIGGANFSGDTWHDLTVVVEKKPDGSRYVRLYTDGVLGVTNDTGGAGTYDGPKGTKDKPVAVEVKLSGRPNFDNNAPLRLGFAPGEMDGPFGKIDVNLAEFKIFNTALPDAVVKAHACDPEINRSHPYYDNLVGYWPLNEGTGTKLGDLGPLTADLTLGGTSAWEQFNDLMCTPSLTNISSLVPKNIDMPTQILSWFNIARQKSWGLEGKVWISK